MRQGPVFTAPSAGVRLRTDETDRTGRTVEPVRLGQQLGGDPIREGRVVPRRTGGLSVSVMGREVWMFRLGSGGGTHRCVSFFLNAAKQAGDENWSVLDGLRWTKIHLKR